MSHTNHWTGCIGLAGVLTLCSGTVANDQPPPPLLIPPDIMCWSVPDASLEFGNPEIPPIPADFFGPGSLPFEGVIQLQGGGGATGGCDVQLQRLGDLSFPGPLPAADTVPIEMVALDLVSSQPIVVQFPGEDTLWDVRVHLIPDSAPGNMNAVREHTHGGVFDCVLPVQPHLTFIRVDDPTDIRDLPMPPLQCFPPVPWPWVDTAPDGTAPNPPGCFLPPCLPPFCPPCPLSSAGGGLNMGVLQNDSAFPPRCVVPAGEIGLPGECPWLPIPGDPIRIPVNPDSSMEMHFNVDSFFDIAYQVGGNFGPDGEIMTCQATLTIDVRGTGGLTDFERTLFVPVSVEVHWPCADPSLPEQTFPNEMVRLEGELFGDPDFCTLLIEGGSIHQPGGGATGATRRRQLPSGQFNVDSFFDIEYRIEWQGCPGSVLDGFGNDPDDLCRHPLVQGGTPPLPGDFFGMPHDPVGGATLGEDANCNLIVSNIGSSGQDGVRINLGEGSQGMCVELDLPAPGAWHPAMRHAHEGFFDLGTRGFSKIFSVLEGNDDGSASLLFDPGSLPFEGTVHCAVLAPDGSTAWTGPLPELIVSNIGSSGKDGVRMCMSTVDNDCCPPWVDPSACEGVLIDLISPLPTEFLLDGLLVAGQQFQIFAENTSGIPLPPMHAGCVSGANIPTLRILGESMYMHCRTMTALDGAIIQAAPAPPGSRGHLVVSNIGSSGCDGVSIDLDPPGGNFNVDSFFDIWYCDGSVVPDPTLPGALHLTGVEPDEIDRGGLLAQMGVTIADNGAGGLDLQYLFGPGHTAITVDVEARLAGAVQDSSNGPMGDPWAVIAGNNNWPGTFEVRRIPNVVEDEIMVLLRPAAGAPNFMVTLAGSTEVEADEIMIRGARPGGPVRGGADAGPRRGSRARGGGSSSPGFSGFEMTGTDLDAIIVEDVSTDLPPCPGDSNGDRTVNLADLLDVIGAWGSAGPSGDVNNDGVVNLADLLDVIGNWGSTCDP